MDSKQARERRVFTSFARASQLPVDMASIKNEPEPKPDVSCRVGTTDTYFELGQILGNRGDNLAKRLRYSSDQATKKSALLAEGRIEEASTVLTAGRFRYPLCQALGQMLLKKLLEKHYATEGKRAELLLYYEVDSPFEPIDDYLYACREALAAALSCSVFSRIWFFDFGARVIPIGDGMLPIGDRVMGTASMEDGALVLTFDCFYPEGFRKVREMLWERISRQ